MIELAVVIRDLRAELEAAVIAAAGAGLQFELGPVELAVSVAVERSAASGAKVRFWVVELGTDAKADVTSAQKVKLTLTPRVAATGATPLIAGLAEPGER